MIAALFQITQLSEEQAKDGKLYPRSDPLPTGREAAGRQGGQSRPSSLSETWNSLARGPSTNQTTPNDRVCLLTR